MKRITGSIDTPKLECINPIKDIWRVRWDYQTDEEGVTTFQEEEIPFEPTIQHIKDIVLDSYNEEIDEKIVSGFEFEGNMVWLSSENQFNYKAAFDLAIMTSGDSLPVTFKFGKNDEPVYRKFDAPMDLQIFYTQAMAYVNAVLTEGWERKDKINWSEYERE